MYRFRVDWKLLSRRCLFTWLGPQLLVLTLAACGSIGPGRLENDQLDYSRTLSDVDKQQTLFNLVRLRYADPPMFASVQQMVAGYTLQGTVQAGLQTSFGPIASSTFGTGQGAVQYTDRPTFTFAPLTGERFVEAYLRPLRPADIMPLIQGDVEDVQDGETIATMHEPGGRRPIILIHTGPTKPTASYVAAQIDGKWFWVERTDYPSKIAFTILEILKSVAESPSAIAPPVLTIPAG
jgi:hypothetical protein